MTTLEPTQVKVGQRLQITHHAKTGGPLMEGRFVYEGTVTAVGEHDSRVVGVRLDPPYYDPRRLEDDGYLPIEPGSVAPWVSRVTIKLQPYRPGTIVRATVTIENWSFDDGKIGPMAFVGNWLRCEVDGAGWWQAIVKQGDRQIHAYDLDIDDGQINVQIESVLYVPRYDGGDPASNSSEGSAP